MRLTRTIATAATAAIMLAACGQDAADNGATAQQPAEATAEGEGTIAAGLSGDRKFADAVKSAGLDRTLEGPGPYTVLVPTDAAFNKLPAGALDALMKAEGRAELTRLLTAHILPGTILAADIAKAIEQGGGKATLPTMGGAMLTATRDGETIILTDAGGAKAKVSHADGKRSNGVIHHIDAVLLPS